MKCVLDRKDYSIEMSLNHICEQGVEFGHIQLICDLYISSF